MSHAELCFNASSSYRPLSLSLSLSLSPSLSLPEALRGSLFLSPPPLLSLSLSLSSFSKSRSLKRFSGADLSSPASNSRPVKSSEANRSTEMMSKTAVKGGKLRSCQHLLFECGRNFEFFSIENPWSWLLAVIMVVATPLQTCPSVKNLGCETQSRDAGCQVT